MEGLAGTDTQDVLMNGGKEENGEFKTNVSLSIFSPAFKKSNKIEHCCVQGVSDRVRQINVDCLVTDTKEESQRSPDGKKIKKAMGQNQVFDFFFNFAQKHIFSENIKWTVLCRGVLTLKQFMF